MFFVLLSCDSLIILSNRYSFVKHFFIFLNSVLSSLSCDSLFILSKCFSFVKNFFVFFCISVLRQKKAQGVGFEPTRPCGQTVFKTASLWPLRYLSNCNAFRTNARMIIHRNQYLVNKFFHFFYIFLYSDDARGKSPKPRCVCTGAVLGLNAPPRYDHNSGYSAFKKASATTISSGVVILILS